MDFTTLTEDELHEMRQGLLGEIDRRSLLAAIPHQVASLARSYESVGGIPADLAQYLDTTP